MELWLSAVEESSCAFRERTRTRVKSLLVIPLEHVVPSSSTRSSFSSSPGSLRGRTFRARRRARSRVLVEVPVVRSRLSRRRRSHPERAQLLGRWEEGEERRARSLSSLRLPLELFLVRIDAVSQPFNSNSIHFHQLLSQLHSCSTSSPPPTCTLPTARLARGLDQGWERKFGGLSAMGC